MTVLEIENLSKTFRSFSLGPIDLELKRGTSHGLIGPNGAGKSTLFRCIVGSVRRDAGQIRVNGNVADMATGDWKHSIGYVGDYTPLFEGWSGERNLSEFSNYYQNWSNQTALSLASRLDLDLTVTARDYSTGQRTKLAIILALAHGANLLLLDEPAMGLDPLARETLMDLLYEQMRNEDLAVLYATHHVSEIEPLVDHLKFMRAGRLIRQESKEHLVQNWRRITFRSNEDLVEIPSVISKTVREQDYEVITGDCEKTLSYLRASEAKLIQESRISVEQISVQLLRPHAAE